MAMAETLKVLSYESLMASLDISSLRELEDLLITGCIYTGVVKGKLNQEKRQFEVHFSRGRDVPFEQVRFDGHPAWRRKKSSAGESCHVKTMALRLRITGWADISKNIALAGNSRKDFPRHRRKCCCYKV